jgi:hypothetical protein
MEEGFCIILYHCLAKRALLNTRRSRKPRPPADLDLPMFSQLIQWIFESLDIRLHQKCGINWLSSLHKETIRRKTLIEYVRMACTEHVILSCLFVVFFHYFLKPHAETCDP